MLSMCIGIDMSQINAEDTRRHAGNCSGQLRTKDIAKPLEQLRTRRDNSIKENEMMVRQPKD